MTNTELYFTIGVPILANALMFGFLWTHMNSRFDGVNLRFNDMRDLWRAELRRVEEVFDARLTRIEEQLHLR